MITKTQSSYPYNRIHSDNPLQLRLSECLVDVLPHGSGINGSWVIDNPKTIDNRFYAHNCFSAMNESGMYCHNYDFTLTIDFIPESGRKQTCQYCNGSGMRYVRDFMQFHPDMNEIELIQWIESAGKTDVVLTESGYAFTCNLCGGLKFTLRHPFELIRLNWKGQKEYTCCGLGLKDYIYESIDGALCEVKGESI